MMVTEPCRQATYESLPRGPPSYRSSRSWVEQNVNQNKRGWWYLAKWTNWFASSASTCETRDFSPASQGQLLLFFAWNFLWEEYVQNIIFVTSVVVMTMVVKVEKITCCYKPVAQQLSREPICSPEATPREMSWLEMHNCQQKEMKMAQFIIVNLPSLPKPSLKLINWNLRQGGEEFPQFGRDAARLERRVAATCEIKGERWY